MTMITRRVLLGGLLAFAFAGIMRPGPGMAGDDVPRMTKEEAKALLGKPNVIFIDARTDSAWKGSDRRITGAVRVDRFDIESQAGNYEKDTTFIVY
jgi:hypothetical protein